MCIFSVLILSHNNPFTNFLPDYDLLHFSLCQCHQYEFRITSNYNDFIDKYSSLKNTNKKDSDITE